MPGEAMLIGKLKECVQETVVFLRTLGDFRIPAVVERRRKELLSKLEELQGDARRGEKPPKFEDSPEKETPTPPVVKRSRDSESASAKSEDSSTVTSPSRRDSRRDSNRDSKLVSKLTSGFETLHATAKKEEEDQTPKKWVELRKTKKPADFTGEENASIEQEEDTTDHKEEKPELAESNELKPDAKEHHGSKTSLNSAGSAEQESTPKTSKKKSKLQAMGGLFKKRLGRDKSPAPTRKEIPVPEAEPEPTENDKEEVVEGTEAEEEPVEMEEGVKMCGKIEHKVKTRLHTKYVQKDVKLKETTLHIGDKETVTMLGCTVQTTDSGFELFSHSTQKAYVFRVTEEGAELKEKWVTAIQAAIDEVSPKEEEPVAESPETVPTIQVSEPVAPPPTPPEATNDKAAKRRESKALEVKKPVKTLPSQEVIKGYIYRKKPGLGSRWEKTYCVVTHTAMYFTEVEGNSEYEHMFQVAAGEAVFTQKDKGHDKNSKSVVVKMGKKTETLSIEKKEFDNWWTILGQAYCFGDSLEFNEEDGEDSIAEEPIDDDMYEDVCAAPPVPNSPRPTRPFIQEVAPEDDIMIDEDIYEDTDDILPPVSEYQTPVASVAPKLPDRNPSTPQPALPPRNAPSSQPALPPRNTGPPLPSRGQLPPPVPSSNQIPPTSAEDEDLYDDVVAGGETAVDEDLYDDVVVGADQTEENYDDVVAPGPEPITEEFYEDMAPGEQSPQEDYMIMEHGDAESDGELYVDVEPEQLPPAPQKAPSPIPPKSSASPKPKSSSTFSRMFAGRKSTTVQAAFSGQVSYRAPKKTKFEERYATVEETNLLVYKTSSDKRHQEKLALGECALELGSTEAGAGKFAIRITKSGKVHHFSFKTQDDLDGWVAVLKQLVKYAPVSLGEQQVYQTTQDHIAEADDQLTFKKGTFIRLISKDNETIWYGQLGNDAQVFNGKTGKFPAEKVVLADDLYI